MEASILENAHPCKTRAERKKETLPGHRSGESHVRSTSPFEEGTPALWGPAGALPSQCFLDARIGDQPHQRHQEINCQRNIRIDKSEQDRHRIGHQRANLFDPSA